MTEPARNASETNFPYGSQLVCYFAVSTDGGAPEQLHYAADRKLAVLRAHANEAIIYAVWPGQYRSDLFVIDDLKRLAATWKVPLEAKLSALQVELSRDLLAGGRSYEEIAETWAVPSSAVRDAL